MALPPAPSNANTGHITTITEAGEVQPTPLAHLHDSAALINLRCPDCRRVFQLASKKAVPPRNCPKCGGTLQMVKLDPLIGATIEGWKIERRIGQGGMGTVYYAIQLSVKRPVALKVLDPKLSTSTQFAKRFQREAQAAAAVTHPNIITVLDAGECDGLYYFAMEYVAGKPLDQLVSKSKPMKEAEAFAIVRQVSDALAHLEPLGLIHRDVKPENILIGDEGGSVKLADFGLAKPVDDDKTSRVTQKGMSLGTPQYMSPEQVEGREAIDIKTDIYALGGTLHFLLTGEPPYEGNSATAIMLKHLQEPVPDPRNKRPTVSAAAANLIQRMMAKSPPVRPGPRQVLELLDQIEKRRSPSARLVAQPAVTRNRASLVAVAMGGLGAMVLGAALIFTNNNDPSPQPRNSVALAPSPEEPDTNGEEAPRDPSPASPSADQPSPETPDDVATIPEPPPPSPADPSTAAREIEPPPPEETATPPPLQEQPALTPEPPDPEPPTSASSESPSLPAEPEAAYTAPVQGSQRFLQRLSQIKLYYRTGRFDNASALAVSSSAGSETITDPERQRLNAIKVFLDKLREVEDAAARWLNTQAGSRVSIDLVGGGKISGKLTQAISSYFSITTAEITLTVSMQHLLGDEVLRLATLASKAADPAAVALYRLVLGKAKEPAADERTTDTARAAIPEELREITVTRPPPRLTTSSRSAKEAYDDARGKFETGSFDAARAKLTELLKSSRTSWWYTDVLLLLADVYRAMGDRTWAGSIYGLLISISDGAPGPIHAAAEAGLAALQQPLSETEWRGVTDKSKLYLSNESAVVRAAGIRMLGYTTRRDAAKTFVQAALSSPSAEVDAALAETLPTLPGDAISKVVKPLLRKKGLDLATSYRLGWLLSSSLDGADEKAWKDLLMRGNLASRLAAIDGLGQRRDVPPGLFADVLTDRLWQVRSAAFKAAQRRSDPRLLPLLEPRLGKEKGRLAASLATAIRGCGGTPPTEEESYDLLGISLQSRRVVLLIRTSGSMSAELSSRELAKLTSKLATWRTPVRTRFDLLVARLGDSLRNMPQNVYFNIVTFDNVARTLQPGLPRASGTSRTRLLADLAKVKPLGVGDLTAGLETVLKIGGKPGIPSLFQSKALKNGPDTVVLVDTGSAYYHGGAPESFADILPWLDRLNTVRRLRIHTVNAYGSFSLRTISSRYGGQDVSLTDG